MCGTRICVNQTFPCPSRNTQVLESRHKLWRDGWRQSRCMAGARKMDYGSVFGNDAVDVIDTTCEEFEPEG